MTHEETGCGLKVGENVPDFEMDTYDPKELFFAKVSFEKLKMEGKGTVLNSEVNFHNLGKNVDELLRKLKANIYLSQHGDEACPAQWRKDGDKTLTPTPEMVGKVYEALEK